MRRDLLVGVLSLLTGCSTPASIGPLPEPEGGFPPLVDASAGDAPSSPADSAGPPEAAPGTSYVSAAVTCSKSLGPLWYAEQTYPGASADDLASVTAWEETFDGGGATLPGYERTALLTQVKSVGHGPSLGGLGYLRKPFRVSKSNWTRSKNETTASSRASRRSRVTRPKTFSSASPPTP